MAKAKSKKATKRTRPQTRAKPGQTRATSAHDQGGNRSKRSSSGSGQDRKRKGKREAKTLLEHLKPFQFKPGVSGNPGGRPKGTVSLTTKLQQMLQLPVQLKGQEVDPDYTYGDMFLRLVFVGVMTGDARFAQMVWDRNDGKVPDHVVIENTKRMIEQQAASVAHDMLHLIDEVCRAHLDPQTADTIMETLRFKFVEKFSSENVEPAAEDEGDGPTIPGVGRVVNVDDEELDESDSDQGQHTTGD